MMMHDIPIPDALKNAYQEGELFGDYLLSIEEDWVQPCDFERIDWNEINQDFDGERETKEGILCGAIRICNTGCEGYHIYVFRGRHEGEIWSDQRVPSGQIWKICDGIEEYLSSIRDLREKHVNLYK